jgi:hypothetical protein
MRGRRQVDPLTNQHVEVGDGISDALKLRQMPVQIECPNALQKAKPVELRLDFDRRWGSVRFGRGMESEPVFHRHAEAREERARESAELLLWRDCLVTVVEEIRDLTLQPLIMGETRHVAYVMVGAYEREMIGVREERPGGFDLRSTRFLAGAERSRS